MSLFRPSKNHSCPLSAFPTFRISLHGRLLASSPRAMLFARKSYGFRPQELWFWSPRAPSDEGKTYGLGDQQRLPTGARAVGLGSKGSFRLVILLLIICWYRSFLLLLQA